MPLPLVDRLRAAIEHLSTIDRASCSPGEREAADWIAEELRRCGADACVETGRVHGTFWWPLGITSGAGALAALLAMRGRRLLPALLGSLASVLAADELCLGRRPLRRLLPKQTTSNVVAEAGDRTGGRLLVFLAHHDAAHSGLFHDPRLAEMVRPRREHEQAVPERQPPVMLPIAAAPGVVAAASLLGLRRLAAAAGLACAGVLLSLADIAHRDAVPGANDNLSGVAALLGLAQLLHDRPVDGLRVLLVSTGGEEAHMVGMEAFLERHGADLVRHDASVVCLDTVGSPTLVVPASEGMLYARREDAGLTSLLAAVAAREGIDVVTGVQVRFGTDGLAAMRAGLPTALLTSLGEFGVASNYHWPTDTADRVDYERLEDAVRLCDALVRELAAQPRPSL